MKIEQITQYVAEDGKIFLDRESCLLYEKQYFAVKNIMKDFPSIPKGDGEFIEVNKFLLFRIRRALWILVLDEYGDGYPHWKKWDADEIHPYSVVGRVLSDSDSPVANAWNKLGYCDFERGRIYQQPYYVTHPNEAKLLEDQI